MVHDIHRELTALLPKMRSWAMGLTRNHAAAEDLAQDVAAKVLTAHEMFEPGTNFSAWVHRIMINHFITGARRCREFTNVEDVPEIAVHPGHDHRIALRELNSAFQCLPADQRQALTLIVLQGQSYEAASETTGRAIGTLKSQVHRARRQLHSHMTGERPMLAA